jgi:hypothetical protein
LNRGRKGKRIDKTGRYAIRFKKINAKAIVAQ